MLHTNARFVIAALALLCVFAATAAPIAVPGTKVAIDPPPGFVLSDSFPGFVRKDVNASIMVTEMPVPVAQLKQDMNKESLATRGMVLLDSQTLAHAGRDALFLEVTQEASGVQFQKWMLITGAERDTTIVVGTFPSENAAELSAPIRQAVLSTALNAAQPEDVFEGLSFRITPSAKLMIAGRMSNTLLLTETGQAGTVAIEAPVYLIGSSVSGAGIGALPAFARARAAKTAQVKDVRNFAGQAMTLDGMEAYELIADATDTNSGKPLRLYQVIAPERDNYFIAQGLVGAPRADEYVAEFRRVTRSFKRMRAPSSR